MAGVLVAAGLSVTSGAAAKPTDDPVEDYRNGAGVPLTVHRDADGRVDFVGSRAKGAHPQGRSVGPVRAARIQWDRLAPVFEAEDTDLRPEPGQAAVGGGSVVRFGQYVADVPVLGGEVVMGLDPRGGVSSAAAHLSTASEAGPASYDIARARRAALAVVEKAHSDAGGLTATDQGTWVYDPALLPGPRLESTATVYRFEVSDGLAVRELVLVHAASGRVLLHFNQVAGIERRVCDDQNTVTQACTSSSTRVRRTETGGAAAVPEVNTAFELIGAASSFYGTLGIDLTDLLGQSDASSPTKALRASVRSCDEPDPLSCPMNNAYWNGEGVNFGQDWAGADDVTGHELTHGVIEKFSNLFYFHESGAINESLADVMGEIIDRRTATAGESESDWRLGEDLPVAGALRDLSNPPAFGQPDKMTSSLWEADESPESPYAYPDNGGVHANSGVGNKTAYLISQGGAFNGRTVKGIDAGAPTMARTAALYLYAIQHLTSGSQYADLGRVLVQGCEALAAAGTAGMTAANCAQVKLATEATELAKSPMVAGARRPAEAPTCPEWTWVNARDLTLTAATLWNEPSAFGFPENSRDGDGSWLGANPDPAQYGDPYSSSATTTVAIEVPTDEHTYLHFSHWHLFEWAPGNTPVYFDGGRLRLEVDGELVEPPASAWVNGPSNSLRLTTPAAPKTGFGGDSNGWTSSRLNLSGYAGKTVRPVWTVAGDSEGSLIGWFLDQVTVYRCGNQLQMNQPPSVDGTPRVGEYVFAEGQWGPAADHAYQWHRNGRPIAGARQPSYVPGAADLGARLSVEITASMGGYTAQDVSPASAPVAAGRLRGTPPSSYGRPLVGRVMTAYRGAWEQKGVSFAYRWLRDGKRIKGAEKREYRLTRKDRGHRISVRVKATKPGYTTIVRSSRKSQRVG